MNEAMPPIRPPSAPLAIPPSIDPNIDDPRRRFGFDLHAEEPAGGV
jgi:hypothetical protein